MWTDSASPSNAYLPGCPTALVAGRGHEMLSYHVRILTLSLVTEPDFTWNVNVLDVNKLPITPLRLYWLCEPMSLQGAWVKYCFPEKQIPYLLLSLDLVFLPGL